MTATDEPVCVVVPTGPLPEQVRAHPFATKTGIYLITRIVVADNMWRTLTPRARDAVRTAYRRTLDAAQPGDTVPLPSLPDDVHPATTRALIRRDLATPDRRLTPLAVEIVAWTTKDKQRPVETAQTDGGRL